MERRIDAGARKPIARGARSVRSEAEPSVGPVGQRPRSADAQLGRVVSGAVPQPLDGLGVVVGAHSDLGGSSSTQGTLSGGGEIVISIGENCLIGANTLIAENKDIPDGSMVLGSPGKVVKQLTEAQQANLLRIADHYVKNHQRYKRDLKPMD